jgi:hypothetical protein
VSSGSLVGRCLLVADRAKLRSRSRIEHQRHTLCVLAMRPRGSASLFMDRMDPVTWPLCSQASATIGSGWAGRSQHCGDGPPANFGSWHWDLKKISFIF